MALASPAFMSAAPAVAAAPKSTATSRYRSGPVMLVSLAGGLGLGAAVIRGQVGHILVRQRSSDRAHRRMVALTALVRLQRLDDVRRVLAADLGHAVDFRIRGAPAVDPVTTSAHLRLALTRDRVTGRRGLGPDEGGQREEREGGNGWHERHRVLV